MSNLNLSASEIKLSPEQEARRRELHQVWIEKREELDRIESEIHALGMERVFEALERVKSTIETIMEKASIELEVMCGATKVAQVEGHLVVSSKYDQKFVDFCRKIREQHDGATFESKSKVWIFDEAHKEELLETLERVYGSFEIK